MGLRLFQALRPRARELRNIGADAQVERTFLREGDREPRRSACHVTTSSWEHDGERQLIDPKLRTEPTSEAFLNRMIAWRSVCRPRDRDAADRHLLDGIDV